MVLPSGDHVRLFASSSSGTSSFTSPVSTVMRNTPHLFCLSIPAQAISLPSGDQDIPNFVSLIPATDNSRIFAPVPAETKTNPPFFHRAICFPSGDQQHWFPPSINWRGGPLALPVRESTGKVKIPPK